MLAGGPRRSGETALLAAKTEVVLQNATKCYKFSRAILKVLNKVKFHPPRRRGGHGDQRETNRPYSVVKKVNAINAITFKMMPIIPGLHFWPIPRRAANPNTIPRIDATCPIL